MPQQVNLLRQLAKGSLFLFFMLLPLTFWSVFTTAGTLYATLYNLPKLYLSAGFSLLLFALLCLRLGNDTALAALAVNFGKRNFALKLLVLLVLLFLLSFFQVLVPAAAFLTLFHYLSLFVLYFTLACFFFSPAWRRVAVYGLSVALLIFTILGIIQFLGYEIPFLIPIRGSASTVGYRNPAAHFIALVIPFVLFAAGRHWSLWRRSKRASQLIFFIAFLFLGTTALILLFMNYCRAAILALMLESLVVPLFWFLSRKREVEKSTGGVQRGGRLLVISLLMLIVIASLIMVFPNSRKRVKRSFNRFQRGGIARLLEARYYHWGNSLMMIKEHPVFGVGLGNWRFNYPLYYKSFARDSCFSYNVQVRKAHNDYLQLAAECGIPTLLLFLLLWGRQFYLLRYSTTADDDGEDWRLPILASLTAFSVIMFFSFPMQMA
ncbi:MAG: O-antigen ligase family protein, partial [Deltaproteobacteria bacterium]|nr:O-antigen ligase family protein [Candidatus Tharpella sp.]